MAGSIIFPLLMFILNPVMSDKKEDIILRPVFLLNNRDIDNLRKLTHSDSDAMLAFEPLLKEAKKAINETPDPVDTIYYEGLIDSDPQRTRTKQSLQDINKANVLAYAYINTADSLYARKVIEYAIEWAGSYKPTGNPINENKLTPLIAAYGMVKESASDKEVRKMNNWIRGIACKNIEKGYDGEVGNWKSKRLKIVGLAGMILGDTMFIGYTRKGLIDYIENNFFSDGTTYDLRQRDALSYHCGGIDPVLSILVFMKDIFPDLYRWENQNGGSVKKSVEFLFPYATGEKVYPQWINSKVDFDRQRYEAGDDKYKPGSPWNPESGLDTFMYAQFFDERFVSIIRRINGSSNLRYPSWETVISVAMKME